MSDSSSSTWMVFGLVAGAAGAMFLIVRLIIGAGHSHPLICWHISPMYDPAQCLVESQQFDN
jgi:hypothetical protein